MVIKVQDYRLQIITCIKIIFLDVLADLLPHNLFAFREFGERIGLLDSDRDSECSTHPAQRSIHGANVDDLDANRTTKGKGRKYESDLVVKPKCGLWNKQILTSLFTASRMTISSGPPEGRTIS
jgi:hypothetical protein